MKLSEAAQAFDVLVQAHQKVAALLGPERFQAFLDSHLPEFRRLMVSHKKDPLDLLEQAVKIEAEGKGDHSALPYLAALAVEVIQNDP